MKKQLFFYYCTILTVLMTVSTALINMESGNYLSTFAMLPISGYFVVSGIVNIIKKKPLPMPFISKQRKMIVVIFFSVLLLISISKILIK